MRWFEGGEGTTVFVGGSTINLLAWCRAIIMASCGVRLEKKAFSTSWNRWPFCMAINRNRSVLSFDLMPKFFSRWAASLRLKSVPAYTFVRSCVLSSAGR